MPSRSDTSKRGSGGDPMFGVPWCHTTTVPSRGPLSYPRSVRPSTVTSNSFIRPKATLGGVTATDPLRGTTGPEDGIALDPEQVSGLGDMDPDAFRAAAHRVADLMADYVAGVESRGVLPPIQPGSVASQLAAAAPETPEPLDAILADYLAVMEPNATGWQHPGFFAYFASTASGPGMLGEMLTAAINQNPMLWRTSPSGTELEQVVVAWLRQALGLPDAFDGLLTDTASTSTLIALAAAREAAGVDASSLGLADQADVGAPRVYAST